MTGTRPFATAYDEDVDTVCMLLLLMMLSDPEAGKTLRSLLALYRENRDIFAMLTKNVAPMSEAKASETQKDGSGREFGECLDADAEATSEKKKPRPQSTAEDLLEDLLRRSGIPDRE